MEEVNKKIDEILSSICKSGKFVFSDETNSYYRENQNYFSLMISDDYKLLTRSLGRHLYLTEFGKKVCGRGGWLKHLEIEEKREKRKEQKENFDFGISKFQAKTKLLPYFVAGISLIISVIALFYKPEQKQQNPIPKTEIITIVDSILASDHYQGDSLLNNP